MNIVSAALNLFLDAAQSGSAAPPAAAANTLGAQASPGNVGNLLGCIASRGLEAAFAGSIEGLTSSIVGTLA